jgi:TolA-binding protein
MNYFDNIEAYLKNKLTPSEKEAFETYLQTDVQLADEIAIRRLEMASYELLVEQSLRKNMAQWATEQSAEKPFVLKVIQSSAFKWAAAACILFVVGYGIWQNQQKIMLEPVIVEKIDTLPSQNIPQSMPNEIQKKEEIIVQLPQQTETPPKKKDEKTTNNNDITIEQNYKFKTAINAMDNVNDIVFDGVLLGENNTDSIYKSASNALKNKQYDEAKILFNTLPSSDNVHFYLSYSLMHLGDFKQAIPLLIPLAQNPNFIFKEISEWHLLLCYYALNDEKSAKPILQKIISDSEHTFNIQAKSLKIR